jgi:hypothetical protein
MDTGDSNRVILLESHNEELRRHNNFLIAKVLELERIIAQYKIKEAMDALSEACKKMELQ